MVQLEKEIVVIALPVYVQLLGRQSETGLELVDKRKVTENHGVVIWVLTAALAFVVAEKECAVFPDGAAQGKPKLVLPQLIQAGSRQFATGIHCIIAEVFVQRAMQIVGAALGNDVDDASNGASRFNAVGVVDHAKLAHRVRGRGGLLYA